MKKEEILAKSRKQGDEMEVFVRDKSMKWTYITMVVVAAIFAFVREQSGQPIMDLCATVSASVAVGFMYRFIRTKQKTYIAFSIIMIAVFVFAVVRFTMGH